MSTITQRIEAAERELAAAKEQLKQEQTPEIIEGHFYVALKQNNTEKVRTGDVVQVTSDSQHCPDVKVWRVGQVTSMAAIHAYKLRQATPTEIKKATTKPEKPFPKLMRVTNKGRDAGNIVWMKKAKEDLGKGTVVHAVENSSRAVGQTYDEWYLEFFEDYEPDTPL
jgi:hypothetical protein